MRGVREGRVWLKVLLGVVGVVVSAALLSTVFFRWSLAGGALSLTPRFPLERFWAELPSQLPWLLPFIACSAAIIPLRALQWQEALPRKVPFRERYHLVAISAFANNTIPGKLGEVVRASSSRGRSASRSSPRSGRLRCARSWRRRR